MCFSQVLPIIVPGDSVFMLLKYMCNILIEKKEMSIKLSDMAILNIKGPDYCCIISLIVKMRLKNWCKMLI